MEDSLRQEKDALSTQLEAARQQIAQHDQVDRSKDEEIAQLKKSVDQEVEKAAALDRARAALENKAQDNMRLYKSETERNGILERHIGRLKEENRALINEDDNERINQLTERINLLEADIKAREGEKADLLKRAADQDQAHDETKATMSTLKAQLDTFKQQLQSKDQIVIATKAQMEVMKHQVDGKDGQIKILNDRIKLLFEQVKVANTATAQKDAAIAKKDVEIASLKQTVADLTSRLEEHNSRVVEAESNVRGRENVLKSVEDTSKQLQLDLDTRMRTIRELEAQVAEAKEKTATLESHMQAKEKTIANVTTEKQKVEEELVKLKEQLAGQAVKPTAAKDYDARIASSEQAVKAMEEQLKQLQKAVDEKETELRAARGQVQQFEDVTVPKLNGELEQLRSKIANLEGTAEGRTKTDQDNVNSLEQARRDAQTSVDKLRELEKTIGALNLKLEDAKQTEAVATRERDEVRKNFDSLQGKYDKTTTTIQKLSVDLAKQSKEIEKLMNELNLVKENSLAENKDRVAQLDDKLAAAEVAVKGRDDRLKALSDQLKSDRQLLSNQTEELAQAKERMQTLQDVEMQAREDEIEILKDKVSRLEVIGEEKETRLALVQEKYLSQKGELKLRVEQIRLLFEKNQTKEEEARILNEKISQLQTQVEAEKNMNIGLETRIKGLVEGWNSTKQELVQSAAKVKELEVRIDGLEDELATKADETDQSKGHANTLDATVQLKDKRIQLLHGKIESLRNASLSKDEKIANLTANAARASAVEEELRKQIAEANEKVSKAEDKFTVAQTQTQERESEIEKLKSEIAAKDDQMKVLSESVDSARNEVSQEIDLLASKIKALEEQLAAKDATSATEGGAATKSKSDDLNTEETALREKASRLEGLVSAKESLIQLLQEKLSSTSLTLRSKDNELSQATAKFKADAEALNKQVETLSGDVVKAKEERQLMQQELDVHKDLVKEYTDKLVLAETTASTKEERMTALQSMMDNLKAEHQVLTDQSTAGSQAAGTQSAIPEVHELQQKLEKISVLYFQTVCLLVKTQLFNTGQLQNVTVKDLYEEVQANEIDMEEWPMYIFARAFAHG